MIDTGRDYTEAEITGVVSAQHGLEQAETPSMINETLWQTAQRYGDAIEGMFAEANLISRELTSAYIFGENVGESIARYQTNNPYDVSFNPYDEVTEPYFEPYLDRFFDCKSSDQVNRVKAQIMIELKHRDDMSKVPMGFNFVTGLLANAGDPLNYVPFEKIGSVIKGQGLIKGAARGALVGGVSNATQELLLKSMSQTYTDEEFKQNVLIGTALSGGIGAIIGRFGKSAGENAINAYRKQAFDDNFAKKEQEVFEERNKKSMFDATEDDVNMEELSFGTSVGAAEVIRDIRIKDDNWFARAALKAEDKIGNPVAQLALSSNPDTRTLTNSLVSTPYWAKGVQDSANIENLMKREASRIHLANDAMKQNYIKYYRDTDTVTAGDRFDLARESLPPYLGGAQRNTTKMTQDEFNAAVYDCIESGFEKFKDNKYILASAQEVAKIRDPLTRQMERMKQEGKLDVGTTKNYMPRVIDKNKAMGDRNGFMDAVTAQLRKVRDNFIGEGTFEKLTIERNQSERNLNIDEEHLLELRKSIKDTNSNLYRLNRDVLGLQGEIHQLEKTIDSDLNKINKTDNKIYSFDDKEFKIAGDRDFAKQVKLGLPNELRPKSVTEQLSEAKVLIDDSDNLLGKDFGLSLQNYKGRNVENYEILTVDELGERLWQEGWYKERPYVDDLVNDLSDDFNGYNKKYTAEGERYLKREYDIDRMRDTLGRLGYNYSRMTIDEINNVLTDIGNKGYLRKQYVNKARSEALSKATAEARATLNKRIEELDYKKKQLEAKREEIEQRNIELASLRAERDKTNLDIKEGKAKLNRLQRMYDDKKELAMATDDDLQIIASDMFDEVAGYGKGAGGYDINIGKRGPLLSRNFLVGDIDPAMAAYLSKDMPTILSSFLRESVDLNLIDKYGSLDLKSQTDNIKNRYNRLRSRVETMKSKTNNSDKINKYNKMIVEIDKNIKKDIGNIELEVGRLRGTVYAKNRYNPKITTGAEVLKSYNIITSLANVVLSSISDVGGVVGKTNLKNAIDSMPALKGLLSSDIQKILRENPDIAYALSEVADNTRVMSFAELSDSHPFSSGIMKKTRAYTDVFMRAIGMNKYNMVMKAWAGFSYFNKLYDIASRSVKGGKLKDYEIDWLHHYGFEESDLKGIYESYNKFGDVSGGQKYAQFRKWDNAELASKVELGSIKIMDEAIVTPGLERHRVFDDSIGSVIFQFKQFLMSAVSRNLIPALQNGDRATVLSAVSLSVGMGCLSVMAKDAIAGREPREADEIFLAGIDQSGIFGWIGEGYKLTNALTYGGFDRILYAMTDGFLGDESMNYFERERTLESVLGPSWQKITGVKDVFGDVFRGDIDKQTLRKIKGYIPLQNAPVITRALDTMILNLSEE